MTLKNRYFALAKKHQFAVAVLLLETLGAAFTAAIFIAGTIVDSISRPEVVAASLGGYITIDAIFVLSTFFAAFTARQLVFQKRWARSAAVFWQILQITIAWNSFSGDLLGKVIGAWLVVSALAGLYLLFSKEVIEGTTEKIDRE